MILSSLFAGIILSLMACNPFSSTTPKDVPDELLPVWETWEALNKLFYEQDQLDPSVITDATIRGMLGALDDPYTAYLPLEEYQITTGNLGGSFEGIGAYVTDKDGKIVIVRPIPGSPAESAGIRIGDIVLAVDGKSIADDTLLEAILKIRGPKGTPVILSILHEGAANPVDITVIRDTITSTSVEYRMIEPGIGYLRLYTFDALSPTQFAEGIEDLRSQGMKSLIFDLRNNTGGIRNVGINIASQFLTEGLVMYSVMGDGTRQDFPVQENGKLTDLPLVVLINGFSASASEIVAGALKDYGRAKLVGTRTLGKGSVTLLRPLSNEAGLNITVARFFTPKGTVIEGAGITPDVIVDAGMGRVADYRVKAAILNLCDIYSKNIDEIDSKREYIDVVQQLCTLPAESNIQGSGTKDIQLDEALRVIKRSS